MPRFLWAPFGLNLLNCAFVWDILFSFWAGPVMPVHGETLNFIANNHNHVDIIRQ